MKKNLLLILLAVGITVSAFGVYYLHKSNYFAKNNRMSENEFGKTFELPENPGAEKPGEASIWRALAWRDENGQIPPNGLSEAIRQRDLYLQQQTQQQETQKQTQQRITTDAIARLNWVSRGPQNVGGRTRSIIIHPNDPNIIWAGSVSGGVWKSTDGGTTWFAMNGNLQNYAISSMAIDPNNPNTLYAGTGEGFFNNDAIRGDGIFKTTDGGMTWTRLPGTRPEPPNYFSWSTVDRISIAHDNSNLILAGTRGGVMRSTDGGNSWTPEFSTYTSLYVAFNPTDSSKAIAEIIDYDPNPPSNPVGWFHRTLYSTDGGDTWQNSNRGGSEFKLVGFFERIELAYSRSNPNIVYTLFPVKEGTPPVVVSKIARSTDGGQNFTNKATQGGAEIGASWYNNTLWVAPNDPDFILAGGTHLFKSTNGGDNLAQISSGYIQTVQPHVDQHCIVSDPGYNGSTNKRVYVCNDGGVFRTDDITTANTSVSGGGWERKDLTFKTAQYYGAAGNGTTGLIYGGTQDNAHLRQLPGSQNAEWIYGGDGGFSAVDPRDDNYCYGEYVGLRIHRSSNCRSQSEPIPVESIYSGISDISDLPSGSTYANFIAPFILDPNNSSRILAGGASLWRTNNARGEGTPNGQPNWSKIRDNPTNRRISAIAVKPGNANVIWMAEDIPDDTIPVAQRNGRIYKTNNGLDANPPWTTIDDNGTTNPLPNRFVTRILIDNDNSNIVYVAFGGFSDDNLWRTENGGTD